MQRIRPPVAMLVIWLFLFYNIERLSKSINFTTPAYLMVPVVAALVLLAPRLYRANLATWLVTTVPIFLLLETWWDFSAAFGKNLLLTLAECVVLAVTIFLARWVSTDVHEFENAVTSMTVGRGQERRTRQGEIYREIQRARVYQRPLSLVALKADEASVNIAVDRIVQEAQQAMIKHYVIGGVSKTLVETLPDYDIVARHNDHMLVLFPEITPEHLPEIINHLQAAVAKQVGVRLQVGVASLPADATTFEGLIEKAVGAMDVELKVASPIAPEQPTGSPPPTNGVSKEGVNGHHSH